MVHEAVDLDPLVTELRKAEDWFARHYPGASGSVPLAGDEVEVSGNLTLEFLHGRLVVGGVGSSGVSNLLGLPREVRQQAAYRLPALALELKRSQAEREADLNAACAAVRLFLMAGVDLLPGVSKP